MASGIPSRRSQISTTVVAFFIRQLELRDDGCRPVDEQADRAGCGDRTELVGPGFELCIAGPFATDQPQRRDLVDVLAIDP